MPDLKSLILTAHSTVLIFMEILSHLSIWSTTTTNKQASVEGQGDPASWCKVKMLIAQFCLTLSCVQLFVTPWTGVSCIAGIFFSLINLFWLEDNCNIVVGFYHTTTWINHRCTCVPTSWNPSHVPPHPIPLGCPRAQALSALLHASTCTGCLLYIW